ncbi:unnamed protein product [Ectocarpus sp. CCAP 1310/34]|nr:unnamed protein product [Ectocarpus sp. CCAP 1310/34]
MYSFRQFASSNRIPLLASGRPARLQLRDACSDDQREEEVVAAAGRLLTGPLSAGSSSGGKRGNLDGRVIRLVVATTSKVVRDTGGELMTVVAAPGVRPGRGTRG